MQTSDFRQQLDALTTQNYHAGMSQDDIDRDRLQKYNALAGSVHGEPRERVITSADGKRSERIQWPQKPGCDIDAL